MSDIHAKTIAAVWRIESPRILGRLVRLLRDIDTAEDVAQEALVAAFETWPKSGVPENPGAWLMTAAKNRARDQLRRVTMMASKAEAIARETAGEASYEIEDLADPSTASDDVLRLMLVACHPVLSRESRVALTLRLVGGLATAEIARAFLQPEPTVAQRIVRAKHTISEARVPFEVPTGADLTSRVASVIEVLYLVFNEGYAATSGEEWTRASLCEEAMRLGRVLCALVPKDPETHAVVALMEIQASRLGARVGPSGEPLTLLDQNRGRWDYMLIARGLGALDRADALCAEHRTSRGVYALQAAIAACHARARSANETDWGKMVALYDALVEATHSPVVELNRAVAVSMESGPGAALELVDELAGEPVLKNYHHVSSVRGDLLFKLGRLAEAKREFERAASLTENARERDLLLSRAARCADRWSSS